jgi:hypothetical protein
MVYAGEDIEEHSDRNFVKKRAGIASKGIN